MRQKWLNYTQAVSAQIKFGCSNLPTGEICYWRSQNYVKGHLRHSYSDADQIWFDLRQVECRERSISSCVPENLLYLPSLFLGDQQCCKSVAKQSKTHPLKISPVVFYISWVYPVPHWIRSSAYQVPTPSWILEIPILEPMKGTIPKIATALLLSFTSRLL